MPKRIRDAKIRNGRPTRQERLDTNQLVEELVKFAEAEPLIESINVDRLCGYPDCEEEGKDFVYRGHEFWLCEKHILELQKEEDEET